MNILVKLFDKKVHWYEKYAYVRLAQSRGSHHWQLVQMLYSHIPELVFGFGLISYQNIKHWLSGISLWVYLVVGLSYIFVPWVIQLVIGHYDLQNKLYERDVRLMNTYNPEIQELLKYAKIKNGENNNGKNE